MFKRIASVKLIILSLCFAISLAAGCIDMSSDGEQIAGAENGFDSPLKSVTGASIFTESFSSGLGQFTVTGSSTRYATSSLYGVRMRGGLTGSIYITSPAISTSGYKNITLTFTRTTSGLDSGEAGIASYSVDGTNFTTIESLQSASGSKTISLGTGAANKTSIYLRFQCKANLSTETYTVDEIVLKGDSDLKYATTQNLSSGPSGDSGVFYPTAITSGTTKFPVFVWGCGAGSDPSDYVDHMNEIASWGFVVVAEVSTGDGTELTAAIDWIIAESKRSGSIFYNKINTAKIAAGGHSQGSVSTFEMASDSRLVTTIHVAGGSFDGNGAYNLRKPAAYICGGDDTMATPNAEADYAVTTVPVFFTIMDGVSHTNAARTGLPAITSWLRWHLNGETALNSEFLTTTGAFCTGIYDSQYKNW